MRLSLIRIRFCVQTICAVGRRRGSTVGGASGGEHADVI
jgi:hypothetical protein